MSGCFKGSVQSHVRRRKSNLVKCILGGAAFAAALIPIGAQAFDWDYSSFKYDLSQKAINGSRKDIANWAVAPTKSIKDDVARAVKGATFKKVETKEEKRPDAKLTFITYQLDGATDSGQLLYTAVVATPTRHNAVSVPVVVFDGHGDCGGECTGTAPKRIFTKDGFATKLLAKGYTVIAFPTAIHKPFEKKAESIDYPNIWAGLAKQILDKEHIFPQKGKKYIAMGSAIGGLTALSLSIADPNVVGTITNGAFFPLELTRREYRIKNHPFCHDYRAFNTYTSVYALLAPRPLMIEVGKDDALWLDHGAVPASDWFSGLKRGATVDETIGASLVLEKIWGKFHVPYTLDVHQGGHEDVDVALADKFLKKNFSSPE